MMERKKKSGVRFFVPLASSTLASLLRAVLTTKHISNSKVSEFLYPNVSLQYTFVIP